MHCVYLLPTHRPFTSHSGWFFSLNWPDFEHPMITFTHVCHLFYILPPSIWLSVLVPALALWFWHAQEPISSAVHCCCDPHHCHEKEGLASRKLHFKCDTQGGRVLPCSLLANPVNILNQTVLQAWEGCWLIRSWLNLVEPPLFMSLPICAVLSRTSIFQNCPQTAQVEQRFYTIS